MSDTAQTKATLPCQFCGKLNRVDLTRMRDRPKCGECTRPMALDRPIGIKDTDFDRVISDAPVAVVVDFYADWCGPCKVMAPLLDQIAHEQSGSLLVLKLDTDRNPAISQRFAIRGIPTLIAFRDGAEVAREVGAVPMPRIKALIERAQQ